MNIFQVKTEYLSILNELECIDGLTPEIIKDTLAPYKIPIEEEILLTSANIKTLEILQDGIKKCISDMTERYGIIESKINGCKQYAIGLMGTLKKTNIEFPQFSVSIRNNRSAVDIIDDKMIPGKYTNERVTVSISKSSIYKDLKEGIEVPGASLVQQKSLYIK